MKNCNWIHLNHSLGARSSQETNSATKGEEGLKWDIITLLRLFIIFEDLKINRKGSLNCNLRHSGKTSTCHHRFLWQYSELYSSFPISLQTID